jgi:hypothetical protein
MEGEKPEASGMKVAQSIQHFIKPVDGHTIEVPGASHTAMRPDRRWR